MLYVSNLSKHTDPNGATILLFHSPTVKNVPTTFCFPLSDRLRTDISVRTDLSVGPTDISVGGSELNRYIGCQPIYKTSATSR